MAFATTAARRGHKVTIFEKEGDIGGQFNMAKTIPGKEEFHETIRYFRRMIQLTGVNLHLNTVANAENLAGFDSVVLATGVTPRDIKLPVKTDKVSVLSYIDVLKHGAKVGNKVAIIGAGGIGFDVAEFITHTGPHAVNHSDGTLDNNAIKEFMKEWGVDTTYDHNGGLTKPDPLAVPRKVYLLQRKTGKLGSTLGKTTGWIHKASVKKRGVVEMAGCKYEEVNDNGLLITQSSGKEGAPSQKVLLDVDTVIVCAGQESLVELKSPLEKIHKKVFLIGGAERAGELDAKRAIDQGTRLAATIETAQVGQSFDTPVPFFTKVINYLMKK